MSIVLLYTVLAVIGLTIAHFASSTANAVADCISLR